jgi:hypothetical protein
LVDRCHQAAVLESVTIAGDSNVKFRVRLLEATNCVISSVDSVRTHAALRSHIRLLLSQLWRNDSTRSGNFKSQVQSWGVGCRTPNSSPNVHDGVV